MFHDKGLKRIIQNNLLIHFLNCCKKKITRKKYDRSRSMTGAFIFVFQLHQITVLNAGKNMKFVSLSVKKKS